MSRGPVKSIEENEERAFLAGVVFPGDGDFAEEYMEELRSLTETAGGVVAGELVQKRPGPDRTYFLGKGKALELADLAARSGANLIIMDNDLSPAQARNLERLVKLRVVDRSQLIMDIFAAGARTLQARKQVELAQLEYTLPRLKRMWSHLSRIRSGIGMRGPGETQLEVDRRMIRKKISELKRDLVKFEKRKKREVQSRESYFKVCLVGYTNSGKSTLLNHLTGASVEAEDKLFSTLDTRTRLWNLRDTLSVLLSDTVGFIRKLPHNLVASFHATLEETASADLLLHVVDCSHPLAAGHIESVNRVLAEIGVANTPQIMVFNKVDRVDDFMEVNCLAHEHPRHVVTSAVTGHGRDGLASAVAVHLLETYVLLEVDVPAASGRLRAFVAGRGDLIESGASDRSSSNHDGATRFLIRLPRRDVGRLREIVACEEGASLREASAMQRGRDPDYL